MTGRKKKPRQILEWGKQPRIVQGDTFIREDSDMCQPPCCCCCCCGRISPFNWTRIFGVFGCWRISTAPVNTQRKGGWVLRRRERKHTFGDLEQLTDRCSGVFFVFFKTIILVFCISYRDRNRHTHTHTATAPNYHRYRRAGLCHPSYRPTGSITIPVLIQNATDRHRPDLHHG